MQTGRTSLIRRRSEDYQRSVFGFYCTAAQETHRATACVLIHLTNISSQSNLWKCGGSTDTDVRRQRAERDYQALSSFWLSARNDQVSTEKEEEDFGMICMETAQKY